MLINIDEEMMLDLLVDRVRYWTNDEDVIELFKKMYENYIYGGCFEGANLEIDAIVDNDYINYCSVISECEEGYEDILALYEKSGLGDISCEHNLNHGYNFIEAEYNKIFLVRY